MSGKKISLQEMFENILFVVVCFKGGVEKGIEDLVTCDNYEVAVDIVSRQYLVNSSLKTMQSEEWLEWVIDDAEHYSRLLLGSNTLKYGHFVDAQLIRLFMFQPRQDNAETTKYNSAPSLTTQIFEKQSLVTERN